jgi:hypothetical protein
VLKTITEKQKEKQKEKQAEVLVNEMIERAAWENDDFNVSIVRNDETGEIYVNTYRYNEREMNTTDIYMIPGFYGAWYDTAENKEEHNEKTKEGYLWDTENKKWITEKEAKDAYIDYWFHDNDEYDGIVDDIVAKIKSRGANNEN